MQQSRSGRRHQAVAGPPLLPPRWSGPDWRRCLAGTAVLPLLSGLGLAVTTGARHTGAPETAGGTRTDRAVAEPVTLTGSRLAPAAGRWSAPVSFPLVPTAAAVLRNGQVLTWAAHRADSFGGSGRTVTAIYDPRTGKVTPRTVTQTGHDMFCSGISYLAGGRVLVTGGDDAGRSSFYNPTGNTWTTGPRMAISRAYHATVTLSDGRVFAIGGSWNGGRGGKNGEIWSATRGWRRLPGAPVKPMLTADRQGVYRSDNHGWLFAWSKGRVLQVGPSRWMNWYGTTGKGSTKRVGTRAADPPAMNGTAVMYDAGRILTLGGAQHYQQAPATARAHVVTVRAGTVTTRRVADMRYARAYHNSVVLPDGTVLVVGGQAYPKPFSDATSVLVPELWNPATGTFTAMAPASVPRNYHSVALLLPDGRVFSGGGGLCGSCATNHPDGQIFTPPYLLNPDGTERVRPVITSAPGTVGFGASVVVGTTGPVRQFVLVRLGTATHTVNTDQRRVRVTSSVIAGGYRVSIPTTRGVVVPGYHYLFAIDRAGVPSVARIIRIR